MFFFLPRGEKAIFFSPPFSPVGLLWVRAKNDDLPWERMALEPFFLSEEVSVPPSHAATPRTYESERNRFPSVSLGSLSPFAGPISVALNSFSAFLSVRVNVE